MSFYLLISALFLIGIIIGIAIGIIGTILVLGYSSGDKSIE